MRAPLVATFALFFAAAHTPPAAADGINCREGNLILTGDTIDQVAAKCGPPVRATYFYARGPHRHDGGTRVDEWLYVPEWGSFPRLVRFANGVVVAIDVLSKTAF